MTTTTLIEGMDELHSRLKTLDSKVSTTIVKASLRAAAKILLAAERQTVPVRTGQMRRAIRITPAKTRNDWTFVRVGVGKKWYTGDQFYAAFVEFGHKMGRRTRGKRFVNGKLTDTRKQIPGEHPIEYAFDEAGPSALEAMIGTMATLIEKVAAGQ